MPFSRLIPTTSRDHLITNDTPHVSRNVTGLIHHDTGIRVISHTGCAFPLLAQCEHDQLHAWDTERQIEGF